MAELAMTGSPDFSAQHVCHELHAVADAKHGNTSLVDGGIAVRRAVFRDALGPPGEDDPDRLFRANRVDRCIERKDLGVNGQLPKPARNQLCEL